MIQICSIILGLICMGAALAVMFISTALGIHGAFTMGCIFTFGLGLMAAGIFFLRDLG